MELHQYFNASHLIFKNYSPSQLAIHDENVLCFFIIF